MPTLPYHKSGSPVTAACGRSQTSHATSSRAPKVRMLPAEHYTTLDLPDWPSALALPVWSTKSPASESVEYHETKRDLLCPRSTGLLPDQDACHTTVATRASCSRIFLRHGLQDQGEIRLHATLRRIHECLSSKMASNKHVHHRNS